MAPTTNNISLIWPLLKSLKHYPDFGHNLLWTNYDSEKYTAEYKKKGLREGEKKLVNHLLWFLHLSPFLFYLTGRHLRIEPSGQKRRGSPKSPSSWWLRPNVSAGPAGLCRSESPPLSDNSTSYHSGEERDKEIEDGESKTEQKVSEMQGGGEVSQIFHAYFGHTL